MRAISIISAVAILAGVLWAQDVMRAQANGALGRSWQQYRLGHLKSAESLAAEAAGRNPQSVEAKTLLALIHAGQGQCATQLPLLQDAWNSTTPAELRKLAGLAAVQCAITQDKPEAGIATLDALRQAYPNDADVLYLGAKLYMKGWNKQVSEMFAKAPSSYRVNQLSGEIFETQGNFAEAAAEYAKAIAKNPEAINLHFRRGRVLLLASHEPATLAQAKQEFEVELSLNAEDAAAVYQIGQILEAQSHHELAVARFEQAQALRPEFPEVLLALAKSRVRDNRLPEGIALLSQVIALQPANETAHYQLMLAYRKSGKLEEAAREKATLDQLQKPPNGEFSDFLKKLGEKLAQP